MDTHAQVTGCRHKDISDQVWIKHKPKLQHRLNIAIFPHLVEELLISEADKDKYIDPNILEHQKKDLIIRAVPRCGHHDYLVKFIKCLRDSSPEAGVAHEELANLLEMDYNKEMEGSVLLCTSYREITTYDPETGRTIHSSSVSTVTQANYRGSINTQQGVEKGLPTVALLKSQWKWMSVHFSAIVWLLLGIIVTVLLSQLPPIHSSHPSSVYRVNAVTVDLGIDTYWLSSATFAILQNGATSPCEGNLYVPNSTCDKVPQITEKLTSVSNGFPIYLLSGSTYNITITEHSATSVEAWLVQGLDNAFLDCTSVYRRNCDEPPAPSSSYTCHRGNPGETLPLYTANISDYYTLCIVFQESLVSLTNIDITLTRKTYNMTTIRRKYTPTAISQNVINPRPVQFSHPFDFEKVDHCVILELLSSSAGCTAINRKYPLKVSVSRRTDILWPPMIAGVIGFILHIAISGCVHCYCRRRMNKFRVFVKSVQ